MTGTRTGKDARTSLRSRLRRVMAVGGLILLATTATGCQKLVDQFKAKQVIRKGNAYFKQQLYEDALKQYEEAMKLDPTEIRIKKFVAMGNMAIYQPGSQHAKDIKALETAIKYFKEYLAVMPEDQNAAKFLVTTYMNSRRYDDAIQYFKDWLKLHADDKQAVQTIAMLYAKKGDFDQSMEWQDNLAKLDPTNAEVFYTIGVTCWDKSYNTPADQMDGEVRKALIDRGMVALDKANAQRADYFEAMLYVNLLYREYAKLENDPIKKEELLAKATEWQKKALASRERVKQKEREEAARKNPLEAI
ncbi:MAG: tetratricopeptide repeat protein [Holophagales bacterium]|nr:tetratricopeptide repeat protein [Holophagales bacterium]